MKEQKLVLNLENKPFNFKINRDTYVWIIEKINIGQLKPRKSLLLLFSIVMIGFCSCNKDEAVVSIANIKVIQNGELKSGVTVYMFKDVGPTSTLFTPFFATKKVITDGNGVASFDLQEVFNLNVIDTQTTLYFAVFNNNEDRFHKTGITIKKGEVKSAEISY